MSKVTFIGGDPYRLAAQLEALALDLRALAGGMTPELLDAPHLDEWKLVRRAGMALAGTVTGHPRIAEGRLSITSELYALDPKGRWARTLSRFYALGERSLLDG